MDDAIGNLDSSSDQGLQIDLNVRIISIGTNAGLAEVAGIDVHHSQCQQWSISPSLLVLGHDTIHVGWV
jgi:hypothetical protein